VTGTQANLNGSGPQARSLAGWTLFAATLALVTLTPLRNLLYFSPSAVADGQWWRVLTHPFVHVSCYHLLLDGTAFLLLYQSLRGPRLAYVAASATGSLLAALWFWPDIGTTGLCGLSGVAHGLMAVSSLEMIERRERLGWVCLAAIVAKSAWEAATGTVFFTWLHFGLMGTPVAVCHAGGVVGGVLAYLTPKPRHSSTKEKITP
jgi:rhomboid family GlyGly-CTERM serine protease